MAYLHSNHIIHRDIKTEKILMDENLQQKIADFGLSKTTSFISKSMNMKSRFGFKGTQAYSAPEVLSVNQHSNASDVYSFAYAVYSIMTGQKPFQNVNYYCFMNTIIKRERPSLDEYIPKAYRELITRCWSLLYILFIKILFRKSII